MFKFGNVTTYDDLSLEDRGPYATPNIYPWGEMILFLMAITGLILNLFVLYVVFYRRIVPLACDTVLMGLIAISDVISCMFMMSIQIARSAGLVDNIMVWCWFDLTVFGTSSFSTLSITSTLSVVRYLCLVRKWRVPWRTSLFSSLIFLVAVWMVIISRGALNNLIVMPSGLYCMPRTDNTVGAGEVVEMIYVTLMLPCPFIIIFCYATVAFRYRTMIMQSTVQAMETTCFDLASSPTIQAQMRKLYSRHHTRKLLLLTLVILSYTVAIAPEYILSFSTLFFNLPRSSLLDTIAFLAMFLLVIINPCFVLHLHQVAISRDTIQLHLPKGSHLPPIP